MNKIRTALYSILPLLRRRLGRGFLAITGIILISSFSYKKKKSEPEEYFSFYADSEFFDYTQEKGTELFGSYQTLSAGQSSATTGYKIYAYSLKDPSAGGWGTFSLSGANLPDSDTVILDGISNNVEVISYKHTENIYGYNPSGRLVFSERTAHKLTGAFEFTVEKSDNTGALIVTNSKFSIIPTS